MTEWAVGITVGAVVLARPQEFERRQVAKGHYRCHLYIVTQRPRMSIEPSSVVITDDEIRGILRLQRGDSWNELPFSSHHRLGPGPLRWIADWPYEDFVIKNALGKVVSNGVVANLQSQITYWPTVAKKHNIVYIGQAFGKSGERTAWDRIKGHETIQRILAETAPDKQVWLTLAAITDENLFAEIEPRLPAEKSAAEDDAHDAQLVKAVNSGSYREKEAVALAEAGLIRYFQPEYNDRMKYSFPSSKQVSLESVRKLDFHGLLVEFQSLVGGLYGSVAQKHASVHFAGFVIHQDNNRAGTIVLQASTAVPGMPKHKAEGWSTARVNPSKYEKGPPFVGDP